MSLFKTSNVREDTPDATLVNTLTENSTPVIDFGEFGPNKCWHLWNENGLNLHDVLSQVISITGPANIVLCSWSISVPAIKTIIKLKETGFIMFSFGVIDLRTRKDHAEAFGMVLNTFDGVRIFPCHAKVIVIQNKDWNVTIAGSANLTQNPKAERIIVCSQHSIANFDRGKIMEMYEQGKEAD
jgi:hypothetical protein